MECGRIVLKTHWAHKPVVSFGMQLKHGIKNYVLDNSVTYGYYNVQNAINDFNRDLYNLYNKYNIIFNQIKQEVPESEKNTIDVFIQHNVYNKELNISKCHPDLSMGNKQEHVERHKRKRFQHCRHHYNYMSKNKKKCCL